MVAAKPIAPDYFATLKIPFVSDAISTIPTSLALLGHHRERNIRASNHRKPSAAGQTVLIDDKPYEIVGLVKDAQMRSAVELPLPVAYLPFWQDDTLLEARMCIRVSGDPQRLCRWSERPSQASIRKFRSRKQCRSWIKSAERTRMHVSRMRCLVVPRCSR